MHHIQHPHPTHSGVDMTEGNITGHLIRFALPLLAGETVARVTWAQLFVRLLAAAFCAA